MLESAFEQAGAARMGRPQIFWPSPMDEYCAVFRSEISVKQKPLLKRFSVDQPYQSAQVLIMRHDDDTSVLFLNTHQPILSKALWTPILAEREGDEGLRGFIIGGATSGWSKVDFPDHEPQFAWATRATRALAENPATAKSGDISIIVGLKSSQQVVRIRNRDPQHDCVVPA